MTRLYPKPARAAARWAARTAPWRCAAAALIFLTAVPAHAQIVYHGFTLVDPRARRLIEDAYMVVDGAGITQVGSGAPPEGAELEHIDMSGRYALPGFIDAHAHITTGVRSVDMSGGTPIVKESPSDELTQFAALVALASGVTTIRNPAGVPDANVRYAERIESGSWLGPDVVQAGTAFGMPLDWGAHPKTEQAWRDAMEREARHGFTYVKLYTGLSESELAQGIAAAHAQGLRTIAHLDRVSWTRAAELGIDALTHALPTSEDLLLEPGRSEYIAEREGSPSAKYMYRWFELVDYDSAPIEEMIRVLAARQILVDLTLVVNELVYRFDEIDTLRYLADGAWMHPDLGAIWRGQLGASLYDWTEEDYRRAKAVMPKVLELARRLHEAGVPLLIGTDGTGGGPFFARELELHVEAGISPWDVLALATTRAAARLGFADRTGALEPGLEADVVFLAGNPLEDIGLAANVDTVIVDGRAYTRATLLERARELAE